MEELGYIKFILKVTLQWLVIFKRERRKTHIGPVKRLREVAIFKKRG